MVEYLPNIQGLRFGIQHHNSAFPHQVVLSLLGDILWLNVLSIGVTKQRNPITLLQANKTSHWIYEIKHKNKMLSILNV